MSVNVLNGIPYFYEFDISTCETSHTLFTRFTLHQIEGFLTHICCLNKSIGRDDIGEKDISLDKNLSASFPDLLTTVIRKKSLPNSQM